MVKKIFAKIYVYLILVLIYLPIFVIVLFSFTDQQSINLSDIGNITWSFSSYQKLFSAEGDVALLVEAFWNTIILGVSASLISTILGTVAAIGIHNSRSKMKSIINNVSQIPVLNAEIVTAVSLSLLFVSIGMEKGFVTLLLAHVTFCTPYVVLSVLPKLKQMNKNLYEAALDLGATPRQALAKVIMPEIMPGVLTGFVLAFTLSIDDFVITVFNSSTFTTLSKYVYETVARKGLSVELRSLSAIMFVGILTVLLIVNLRKSKKEANV